MKILGIDPGYERLGISIIEKQQDKDVLLFSECFQTDKKTPFQERLLLIGQNLQDIITTYKPDVLSIEKLYFTSNQKTAMNVSQVIGAIIFIVKSNNLDVFEYTPLQIKSACTGSGKADKKQIMAMLPHLIRIEKEIKLDDEFDAIAVAITHSAYIK
jgi:crossover junction endodeoxyribonuclease RuvC